MNSIEDYPWNEKSDEVIKTYKCDNYVVEDMDNNTGRAVVFCSGNGLYYPNTSSVFYKRILHDNYYEWWRVGHSKHIVNHFQRVIYIRDIYKQWYVKGINEKCDSIDKLYEQLEKMCVGFKVSLIGVSAGGYIATILGSLLCAERVVNISGQWLIEANNNLGPFVDRYANDEKRNKYYDVSSVIERNINSGSNIFYFWPCKSEQDIIQHDKVMVSNVNSIPIDCYVHGSLFRQETFPYLLTCKTKRLKKLCRDNTGKIYSDNDIFVLVVPLLKVIYYRMRHVISILIRKSKICEASIILITPLDYRKS